MAVPTTRRRRRDPEGRMALREHLTELRRRVVRSAIAILLGAVVGWFLYDWVIEALIRPIKTIQAERGPQFISINFGDVASPFNLKIQLSILTGLVLASPVWLYQLWAFVTPGLTRKERRYSFGFVAVSLPLFLGGAALAWWALPKAIQFFSDFVPSGGTIFISANTYFSFVTRIILAFGIAFVIPVLLVALNMVGVLSGRALVRQWRVTVFACFLFAAIATPTPEATTMCILAGAMCLLFGAAIAICLLIDRRRARRAGEDELANLADDEASEL
ncbi:MAG TPA: twin-arginine translocase subunit TatC [Actinomycetales bacterium]|nr:twin-arginine translocase subunit TatC [Actinomycetales bacterium]